jgi:hypothetical protein
MALQLSEAQTYNLTRLEYWLRQDSTRFDASKGGEPANVGIALVGSAAQLASGADSTCHLLGSRACLSISSTMAGKTVIVTRSIGRTMQV